MVGTVVDAIVGPALAEVVTGTSEGIAEGSPPATLKVGAGVGTIVGLRLIATIGETVGNSVGELLAGIGILGALVGWGVGVVIGLSVDSALLGTGLRSQTSLAPFTLDTWSGFIKFSSDRARFAELVGRRKLLAVEADAYLAPVKDDGDTVSAHVLLSGNSFQVQTGPPRSAARGRSKTSLVTSLGRFTPRVRTTNASVAGVAAPVLSRLRKECVMSKRPNASFPSGVRPVPETERLRRPFPGPTSNDAVDKAGCGKEIEIHGVLSVCSLDGRVTELMPTRYVPLVAIPRSLEQARRIVVAVFVLWSIWKPVHPTS